MSLVLAVVAAPALAGPPGAVPQGMFAQNSAFGTSPQPRDWPHDIKWEQGEFDLSGNSAASWIDNDTPSDAQTVDDFLCSGLPSEQFITDIEFPGFSYYGDTYLDKIRVSFYTDVPAVPGVSESMPGTLLYQYDVEPADQNGIGWQAIDFYHTNGVDFTSGYKINLPQDQWFDQGLTEQVLWLSIQGVMVDDGYGDYFYWGFRNYGLNWGDDAAFQSDTFGFAPWAHWGYNNNLDPNGIPYGTDIYEGLLPAGWDSVDMAFRLSGVPEPSTLLLLLPLATLIRRR